MIYINRFLNFIAILLSYLYSQLTRRVIVAPMPFAITIEPTNKCNLHCPECPTGNKTLTREKGEMNILFFEKLLQAVYKKTFYLNLYFQGEPFLHKDIVNMIRLARFYKMYVVISTNGQDLNAKIADEIIKNELSKIIISLDGLSQETYEKYRKGGNIEKVKETINFLIESKKKLNKSRPLIEVQILVNSYNEKELREIKQWLKTLGNLKITFKSMQVYNDFSYLPENANFKRYFFDGKEWKLKYKIRNRCFRIWSQCVITHNGMVIPCCFDKNANINLGNLNHQPFDKIWNGKSYNDFRLSVLRNRSCIDMCNNCTE